MCFFVLYQLFGISERRSEIFVCDSIFLTDLERIRSTREQPDYDNED